LKFKLKLGVKKRFKSSLNLELSHHMEQIQIRQPKMPAAQSFIQILGTFLAQLFIFIASLFSYIKFHNTLSQTNFRTKIFPFTLI